MRWLLGFTLLALQLSPAFSYSDQHCARLVHSSVAAFQRQDWRGVLESSSDYEKECIGIGGGDATRYVAEAIGRQAEALFWLSRFGEALSAAERCLTISRISQCYLGKARALLGLGRVAEARTALQETKRSASALIDMADARVRAAPTEGHRELWSATRSSYRAQVRLADAILTVINERFQDQHPRGQLASGSGIVISKNGRVLTNHHVTRECLSIEVHTASGPLHATLKAYDPKADLALLETSAQFSSFASFRSAPAQTGEPIAVVGFPLPGLLSPEGSVHFGHISALLGVGGDVQRMQISASVQKGNSGGPVLDQSGLLLGVVVEKLDTLQVARMTGDVPQNISFAIKSEVVQLFLRSHGSDLATAPAKPALSTTNLATAGKELTVLITCKR